MKKLLAFGGVVVCLVAAVLIVHALRAHKTVTTTAAPQGNYVALGDSVAAGDGLKTDSDASACNRTNESYPNQVATMLNQNLKNITCSGATLTNGILGQQNVNQLMVQPQLTQLFTLPRPSDISVTIGANDAGWTSFLAKCYTGECGTAADTAGVSERLAVVTANLRSALTQIQNHYQGDVPHIVVTGYYQIFPASLPASCSDVTGIDAGELAWVRQEQSAIDAAIQAAVSDFSFARFTSPDFTGHELCSADPWVQGLNDKAPYHPTVEGQTAYARQVTATIKAFK